MSELPVSVVPETNEPYLNEKQYLDYETHRRQFLEWLTVCGKDPETVEGYAEDTVKRTAYRCGKFDRWVWNRNNGYTMPITHDHADAYLKHLTLEAYSGSHRANTKDALLRYFKWRELEYGEPSLNFSKDTNLQPPDFLSVDERKRIRQAALDYGSIPTSDGFSPDERERWRKQVMQLYENGVSPSEIHSRLQPPCDDGKEMPE